MYDRLKIYGREAWRLEMRNQKGYTLIEFTIVVAVLLIGFFFIGRGCYRRHHSEAPKASATVVVPVSRNSKPCHLDGKAENDVDAGRATLACQMVVDSGKLSKKQIVRVNIRRQPNKKTLCTVSVGDKSASALSSNPDEAVSSAATQMIAQLK
jgi:prepilin-type N-terminal cleavage/methylation domain-containing protein